MAKEKSSVLIILGFLCILGCKGFRNEKNDPQDGLIPEDVSNEDCSGSNENTQQERITYLGYSSTSVFYDANTIKISQTYSNPVLFEGEKIVLKSDSTKSLSTGVVGWQLSADISSMNSEFEFILLADRCTANFKTGQGELRKEWPVTSIIPANYMLRLPGERILRSKIFEKRQPQFGCGQPRFCRSKFTLTSGNTKASYEFVYGLKDPDIDTSQFAAGPLTIQFSFSGGLGGAGSERSSWNEEGTIDVELVDD